MATETRPGWKTTEFWALILVNVLPEIGAIDVGDTKIKGLIHLVTVFGYAIARGLAKQGVSNTDVIDELAGKSEGVKAEGYVPPGAVDG